MSYTQYAESQQISGEAFSFRVLLHLLFYSAQEREQHQLARQIERSIGSAPLERAEYLNMFKIVEMFGRTPNYFSVLMSVLRIADQNNLALIKVAFPFVAEEYNQRYRASLGIIWLEDISEYIEYQGDDSELQFIDQNGLPSRPEWKAAVRHRILT